MNMSGIIRKLIADDANAFALVGSRVYPLLAPDAPTYPLVTVKMISDQPTVCKGQTSPVDFVGVQVDHFAKTFAASCEVRAAVRAAVDGFRGDVTFMAFTNPVDGIKFENGSQEVIDVQAPSEQMRLFMHSDIYQIRLKMDSIVGGPGTNPGALPYYASDDDAIADDLSPGQEYLLNGLNIYGMPAGMRKIIQ